MKRQLRLNTSMIRLLCLCIPFLAFSVLIEQKLTVESNHSTIQFSVPISNGLTRITGKFTDFSIQIDYVDGDITKSRIVSSINVESINTGIPARDEDLRTKEFFDIVLYPQITFQSDSIRKVNEELVAYGEFKMHGMTKYIELPFRITGYDGEGVIGFTSRFKIKRSEFGVGTGFNHTTDDNFIGDEIDIEIDFWTKKHATTD